MEVLDSPIQSTVDKVLIYLLELDEERLATTLELEDIQVSYPKIYPVLIVYINFYFYFHKECIRERGIIRN